MKRISAAFLIAAIAACAGCKNVAPAEDQAAVIVEPDAASRAALQAAVNDALRTEVALADDALTETSLLMIEHRVPTTVEGNPAGGRMLLEPIQFQLVISGDDCVLIDQRNQSRTVLQDTECEAEPTAD